MSRRIPNLSDIYRKQFENQFSLDPAHKIFTDPKKAIFITGVEAGAGWSITYQSGRDDIENTRSGAGNSEFIHPVYASTITATSGITKLHGFFMDMGI